jgi:hypothetical protein
MPPKKDPPNVAGSKEIAKRPRINETEKAYQEIEREDYEDIVNSQVGKPMEKMFFKFGEVVGISSRGIFTIKQKMGLFDVSILPDREGKYIQIEVVNGIRYMTATAIAQDYATGNKAQATFYQDLSKKGLSLSFAPMIVQTKAKRNAIRELLDQGVIEILENMARAGKKTFDFGDAESVFGSIWKERRVLKDLWFKNQLAMKSATTASLPAGEPQRSRAALQPGERPIEKLIDYVDGEVEDLPPPQKTPKEEELEKGMPTENQKIALGKLLKKGGYDDELSERFIQLKVGTYVKAAEFINEFSDNNFADVERFLKSVKAAAGSEGQGSLLSEE